MFKYRGAALRCATRIVVLGNPLRTAILACFIVLAFAPSLVACQGEKEHIAPAVRDRDSVSMMKSYGVNTLISDSGVMKYRIVAEEWEVNTVRNPTRWIFTKGLFMEQFDPQFHIEAFVQADTAYYYDQQRLWELRGRVRVNTVDGLRFASEELFWDQQRREFYSHLFSRVVTPERTMQGTYFRSDEQMTRYLVTNSKGSFESADFSGKPAETDQPADTTIAAPPKRQPTTPIKKSEATAP